MEIVMRCNEGGLSLVAALATIALLLSASALAQDTGQAQPKTPSVQQPEAPPLAAPAAPTPAQPTWAVNCTNSQAGLDCSTLQTMFVKETGQRLLTVAVRMPPDTKKPVMLVQLPLGIYLPAGATIQFGKDQAKMVPLRTCDQNGCVAEYAITEAEIAAMAKGANLTVSMQNLKKEAVPFTVPVLGFAAAYAKIK
jgi:invasion protein IalB